LNYYFPELLTNDWQPTREYREVLTARKLFFAEQLAVVDERFLMKTTVFVNERCSA